MIELASFLSEIEGPYKWYVLGGVLVVITALVTKFIFKTLKWFVLMVAAAVIGFTIANYFMEII
jgi:hypothetical protein